MPFVCCPPVRLPCSSLLASRLTLPAWLAACILVSLLCICSLVEKGLASHWSLTTPTTAPSSASPGSTRWVRGGLLLLCFPCCPSRTRWAHRSLNRGACCSPSAYCIEMQVIKPSWCHPVQADPMGEMIGLPSDRVLPDNPSCRPVIEEYAADQQLFFDDFAAAYVKMCSLGARWRA